MEEELAIGIDIGSTSVKVGIYRTKHLDSSIQVLETANEQYPDDAFQSLESHGYHQMNLALVLETIERCIEKLKYCYRNRVNRLGICGQMHGIVFWNENTDNGSVDQYPWFYDPVSEHFTIDQRRFSSYITWQDNRCSQDFIGKLITDFYIKSEMASREEGEQSQIDNCCGQMSSGFGLTTALWFIHNDKKYLYRFNRCGTPMTIILMMLKSSNPTLEDIVMLDQTADRERLLSNMNKDVSVHCKGGYCISDQMAASWGFYNLENSTWRVKSLHKLGFVVGDAFNSNDGVLASKDMNHKQFLLPTILPACTNLGSSSSRWLSLHRGVQLFVENGDMQCCAKVCLSYRSKAAILNISTSVQMAIVVEKLPPQQLIDNYPALTIIPYLNGQYLVVAASLNGGNVLQKFVESIHEFSYMLCKSRDSCNIQLDDIWSTLLSQKPPNKPSIIIKPTIFGERHDPTLTGSILNIKGDNLNIASIMSSLCYGIIDNILTMMPFELLKAHDIEQIVCIGSVIQRNSIMRSIIETTFKQLSIRVNFLLTADAQEGAAMIALEEFIKS